jgi:hypothetical protein
MDFMGDNIFLPGYFVMYFIDFNDIRIALRALYT